EPTLRAAPRPPRDHGRAAEPQRRGEDGSPSGLLDRAAMGLLRVVVRAALALLFRLRIENPPRLDGGFVVVANHASFLDPILLGAAIPRRVRFLMTALHFRSPWLGWFYRWQRAIPLASRGGNREPLRIARETLRQGGVLGVFPEGGLSRDGGLLLGSAGAVSLVLSADVPVVPAYIDGAAAAMPPGRWPRPRRSVVRFGEPIPHDALAADGGASRKALLRSATRTIMDAIA